jgi:hypothetical protein
VVIRDARIATIVVWRASGGSGPTSHRAKDRALQVAGWRVVRITWRQLRDDANTIGAHLAALLARS